jgi:hypothetical protein
MYPVRWFAALIGPNSLDSVFNRLQQELNDIAISMPVFVENILHNSGRGIEVSQVYWCEVLAEPKIGEFHPVEALPDLIVKSQLDFIPAAIEAYTDFRSTTSSTTI